MRCRSGTQQKTACEPETLVLAGDILNQNLQDFVVVEFAKLIHTALKALKEVTCLLPLATSCPCFLTSQCLPAEPRSSVGGAVAALTQTVRTTREKYMFLVPAKASAVRTNVGCPCGI